MFDYKALARMHLSEKRYRHSLQVAVCAVDLAHLYEADPMKAWIAGLLHDYAKPMTEKELLEYAETKALIEDPCEREAIHLLHGPVAASRLAEAGIVTDPDILAAIASHTVGHPKMSLLEKIIYLADYIEPGRKTPGVEKVRKLSYKDLDESLLLALDNTIYWLLQKKAIIHPNSIRLRNELLL